MLIKPDQLDHEFVVRPISLANRHLGYPETEDVEEEEEGLGTKPAVVIAMTNSRAEPDAPHFKPEHQLRGYTRQDELLITPTLQIIPRPVAQR
jgi:hypothetical protein